MDNDLSAANSRHRKGTKFLFLLSWVAWFLPLAVSAFGERAFPVMSCILLNRLGRVSAFAAAACLLLIPFLFWRSKSRPRLRRLLCLAALADVSAALLLNVLGYVPGAGDEYHLDYLSFFWERFFDVLHLRLSDPISYLWGKISIACLSVLVSLGFTGCLKETRITQDEGKKTFSSQTDWSHIRVWKKIRPAGEGTASCIFPQRLVVAVMVVCAVFGILTAFLLPRFFGRSHRNGLVRPLPEPGVLHGEYWPAPGTENLVRAARYIESGESFEGYRILSREAQKGDANAMSLLAEMYFAGASLPTRTSAFRWLDQSLRLRSLAALRLYTWLVDRGSLRRGSVRDRYFLHELGSRNDENYAATELGLDFMRGRHVSRDFEKGAEYLKRAADRGDPFGLVEFGYLYYRGDRVGRDWDKARWLFEYALLAAFSPMDYVARKRAEYYLDRIERGLTLHDPRP